MQSGVVPTAQQVVPPLLFGTPTSKEVLERHIGELRRFMGILDARLKETGEWLAAGRYTVADVAHVGHVLLLKNMLGECLRGAAGCLPAYLPACLPAC